jgi:hypothetical protein
MRSAQIPRRHSAGNGGSNSTVHVSTRALGKEQSRRNVGDRMNTKLMLRVIGLPRGAAAAAWLLAPLAAYYRTELTLGAGGLVLVFMIYREWLRNS